MALLAIAAAATGPARAQSNTVRWDNNDMSNFYISSQGDRETIDDVTLTSNGGTAGDNGSIYFNGAFTFSVPPGSVFTQIVIRDDTWLGVDGWSVDEHQTQATWTGSARSVSCQIGASNVQYIEFTIAPAVPQMYTSSVSITDLVPGDTLAEGATIIGSGNDLDMVFLGAGRTKENGVVPQFWTNLFLPPTVIGTNGTISKTNTYTPVDENGQDGNAWVVTSAEINYNDGFEVGLAGIIIPQLYNVTFAEGTEDVGNWSITPAEATTGVTEGTVVTVKYNGTRRINSIELKSKKLTTPLTMEAITAGTIMVQSPRSGMQYSKNGGTKTAVTSAAITVAAGDKVAFYGDSTNITSYSGTKIGGSGDGFTCKVYGNIMSLVNEEHFDTATTLTANNAFNGLFKNNVNLSDASGLLLPATTLTANCYVYMFQGCTSLTTAPALPAPVLAPLCYYKMFQLCTKLNSVTCLATDFSATGCIRSWLDLAGDAVQGTKTFNAVSTAEWPTNSVDGIPEGWTRQDIGAQSTPEPVTLVPTGNTNEWTFTMPADNMLLMVNYYGEYTLDSIPLDWQVKVGNAAPVHPTAYTEGNTTLGHLTITETDSVTLIPDNPRRVKSVTLEDEGPAVQTVTIGNVTLQVVEGETWRQIAQRNPGVITADSDDNGFVYRDLDTVLRAGAAYIKPTDTYNSSLLDQYYWYEY